MNRAGSFLYEPAGSVHTLQCVEDDTQVWFQMYGVEPQPRRRRQRRERLRRRRARSRRTTCCARPRACHGRTCWSIDRAVDLADPSALRRGPAARGARRAAAHAPGVLAGDARRARVLGRAQARRRRARRPAPEVFSASEGGVVLEDLAPEQLEMMRNMLLAMDPPRHDDVPASRCRRASRPGSSRGSRTGSAASAARS